MKLFWLSKFGTNDSFSRIGKNILCNSNYQLYTAVPRNSSVQLNQFVDYITIGEPIVNLPINLPISQLVGKLDLTTIEGMIKYTFYQVYAFCIAKKIDVILIVMGVYEANLLLGCYGLVKEVMNSVTKEVMNSVTKVVVYSPFDYVPSSDTVSNYKYADDVIVTNDLIHLEFFKYSVIPHANDSAFKKYPALYRSTLIKLINDTVLKEQSIKGDDIIILNFNQPSPRKRLETTVFMFAVLIAKYPEKPFKLWLNCDSGDMNVPKNLNIIPKNRVIVTPNLTDVQLNWIYNVSQIGLQTSWGEGWSFTNCEHAMCGGLQVVPDWLATGEHFANGRGITYPVIPTNHLNEAGTRTIIGVPENSEIFKALEKAVLIIENGSYNYQPFVDYYSSFNWKLNVELLSKVLKQLSVFE